MTAAIAERIRKNRFFRNMCRAAGVLAERLSATRLKMIELSGSRLPKF
jgi:hypothetical protein